MIDHVLELYPAIAAFLAKDKQDTIRESALTSIDLAILDDIRQVLMIPHIVQQMLSTEKMPTLPNVIPAYEQLAQSLRALEAIEKIETYMLYARTTRVYALAMAINPLTKFEDIEATWGHEDADQAKEWLREAMLEHRLAERRRMSNQPTSSSATLTSTDPFTAHKPQFFSAGSSAPIGSLAVGLAKLRQYTASAISRPSSLLLSRTASNASSDASVIGSAALDTEHSDNSNSALPQEPTAEEHEERERQAIEDDRRLVDREIKRWCSAGITGMSAEFDLVLWWQSKAMGADFPLIYRVALDILSMQASAVPCERVFSSSKNTSSLLRSQMSPQLMEICQILKYLFKQQRLDSTGEWCVSDPDTLDAADPPEDQVADSIVSDMPLLDGLAMAQRVDELYCSLFTNETF
ncbi:hypothetical protein EWM64_g9529 [Hericium alpestre]|uniref:HAT C-terminal dimerisation domain-containing protein n=1 Tax=Hericium alpestre TaxID=135208 RepID=A0A4Y9ZIJ0_9AGAM|nr:hypothetical protein EWM64_g9529 [Hericium alpestre]